MAKKSSQLSVFDSHGDSLSEYEELINAVGRFRFYQCPTVDGIPVTQGFIDRRYPLPRAVLDHLYMFDSEKKTEQHIVSLKAKQPLEAVMVRNHKGAWKWTITDDEARYLLKD